MLRTTLAKAYIKRTFRPTYGWTQMTPKSQYLDPAWNNAVNIFPGMVMMKTVGENVSLIDATGHPMGFAAFYEGGDGIFEISEQGVNACAVWVMAPDAEAEVLAPAFDVLQTWTEPTNGTALLVHAQTAGATRGQLVPAGTSGATTRPVARLVKTVSATKIVIGGLQGTN